MKSAQARVALLLTVALAAFAIVRTRPADRGRDVAAGEFSGSKAYVVLESLYRGMGPHPVGSAANAVLRDRIVGAFRRLGCEPRVQREFVCNRSGRCAGVENIVAELPGPASNGSVLLVSHYDSVPAGAGVADDGSGVAITLEIARLLKAAPPPNRVTFLITDGEEAGLLGAEAFVARDPAVKSVRAVVNLEARGTSGSSYMFETNRHNAWLVSLLSRHLARPATSSLFYAIYERLPNDTDFSVFKRAGLQGANFAFVGDPLRYHTTRDDLAHLSRATLHAHGTNALAIVRALAESDLDQQPAGNATYFDVLQLFVVSWPEGWSIAVAGGVLLVLLLQLTILMRRTAIRLPHVFAAAGSVLIASVLAAAVSYGGALLLRASGAAPGTWVARPAPAIAFFWIAGIFAAVAAALPWLRDDRAASFWAGSGLLFSVLGLVSAAALPGSSFLFVVPSVAYCVVASLWLADTAAASAMRWFAPAAGAAIAIVPLAAVLYQGMGLPAMPLVAACASLIAATMAIPMLTASPLRGRLLLLLGSLAVAALVTAALLPPWSVDSPRPLNFAYELREDGSARWLTSDSRGDLPASVMRAARWSRRGIVAFPPSPKARYFEAVAPAAPVPLVSIASAPVAGPGGRRSSRLIFRNAPAGARIVVAFHDRRTIDSIQVNGVKVNFDERRRDAEWTTVTLLTPGSGESEVLVGTSSGERLETVIQQITPSLPAAGAALLAARPADASPIQSGDVTLVTRRLKL